MRRTIINHDLAKALMAAGMSHFDDGGMVAPSVQVGSAAPATAASGKPGFLGMLTGQNDYEANLAPTQQSNYGGVINSAAGNSLSGYGNFQGIQSQQQALANALLSQSQGNGPNPAQAALNQNTGQNAANQAALMASQRGSGANVGNIARQAAMQGAAVQQNAAGQAATLQAQQQIAAQQALAQQQQAMQSGNIAQQGASNQLFGLGAGAQNAQNNSNIQNYANVQGINSGVAEKNAGGVGKAIGGVLGGIGSIFGLAKGGEIPDHMHRLAKIYHPHLITDYRSGGPVPGHAAVKGDSAKNDTVPALLSPGEQVLPRSVTQSSNAPEKAAEFVRHLQDKHGGGGKEAKGYQPRAESKKSLKARVERLEKLFAGGSV